jgi:hypothetical protein
MQELASVRVTSDCERRAVLAEDPGAIGEA